MVWVDESEKITFNINVVELGKVGLLVEQGFYSNRTELGDVFMGVIVNSLKRDVFFHASRPRFYTRRNLEDSPMGL